MSTTNSSTPLLEVGGTTLILSPARKAYQLVFLDGSSGNGNVRLTAINGISQGDATSSGAYAATGIANVLMTTVGAGTLTLLPSNASITAYVSPIVFSGGS